MTTMEKLRKEMDIAKAMKAELQEMANIGIDKDGKLESKRLHKFLDKTTVKIANVLERRLGKLNDIIDYINLDIEKEQAKQQEEVADAIDNNIESMPGKEDGITEFEKMIDAIFKDLPTNIKTIKIPRD